MIKPTKELKTAGCITILITIVMIFVCFTTACLPNSESTTELSTPSTNQATEENKEIVNNQNEEPDNRFVFEAQPDDRIKVIADAEIINPNFDKVPLMKVIPKNITEEQFNAFIYFILGDRPVFNFYTNEEYDGKFVPSSEGYRTTLSAQVHEQYPAYLQLIQSSDEFKNTLIYRRHGFFASLPISEPYTGEDIETMEKSYNECLQDATDLIATIDGENSNMKLISSYMYQKPDAPSGYSFIFKREYSGVSVKYIVGLRKSSMELYSHEIYPEILQVFVDDEGILSVHWTNYKKDYEVIENNLTLPDFDTIINTFKNNYSDEFLWVLEEDFIPDERTAVIHIEKIELNYMYAYDTDTEEYYLTPVWDFIGDIAHDRVARHKNDPVNQGVINAPLFTVNAVDGTIVNRNLGY